MANIITNRPQTHLVIPDSHAHPDHPNDRFTWLGKLISDVKPDVIINIGDLADMASLCAHSKPAEIEGARYKADCDAAIDAQDRIWHELRKHKKKLPRAIWCLGNHDIRPERYVQDYPVLEGKLKNTDIGYEDYPWEVYPFLDTVRIDGIAYSHYFTSGVMNRPIGGMHPAYTMLMQGHESRTCGHSHLRDYRIIRSTGRDMMGLVAGCYIDYDANYAGVANKLWDRGVSICHSVDNGIYDYEFISLDRIRRAYG